MISGVAKDKNVARLALVGVEDRPGIAYKVFSLLGQQNINVDIILQSIGRDESQDISFTVRRSDVDQALALLEAHKSSLAFDHIDVDNERREGLDRRRRHGRQRRRGRQDVRALCTMQTSTST